MTKTSAKLEKKRAGLRPEMPEKKERGAYPFYGLRRCLEIAKEIRDLGGDRIPIEKEMLAQHLQLEENSASLAQILASAKCFGIIEGRSGYSLTKTGERYFSASPDNQQGIALDFLTTPSAFKLLIERFDGTRLPPLKTMRNLLKNEKGVPESWVNRAVSNFTSSATELAVLENGILRYQAMIARRNKSALPSEPMKVSNVETQSAPGVLVQPTSPINVKGEAVGYGSGAVSVSGSGIIANAWVYSNDEGTIRLETPVKLSMDLWARLNGYVQILKPVQDKPISKPTRPEDDLGEIKDDLGRIK